MGPRPQAWLGHLVTAGRWSDWPGGQASLSIPAMLREVAHSYGPGTSVSLFNTG